MTRPRIAVVDLGVGNLANVARALRVVGAEPTLTSDPETIGRAERIVLPGVGAFRPPREALRGAVENALRSALAGGARLLGICVGYQLLFESSEEFGVTEGLGLLVGRVTRIPTDAPAPHMGWNRLELARCDPLLEGIENGTEVYFVHSFAPEGVPPAETLATALHGREFAAVAGAGRVRGTQFHPEKSGDAGLRILRNFTELAA